MPRRLPHVLAAALVLAAAACGSAGEPTGPGAPITSLPRALTASERVVVAGSNRFAWDLLRSVHEAAPDSSVFLSPLSASMALGMTALGAEGTTWSQVRDMLGFEGLGHDQVGAAYRGLLDLLPGLDPVVRLDIANASGIGGTSSSRHPSWRPCAPTSTPAWRASTSPTPRPPAS